MIEEFMAFAEGESPFDFERFTPYPEEFRRLDDVAAAWDRERAENPGKVESARPRDGYNAGGYEWCVANWGTKWRAFHVDRKEPEPCDREGSWQVVIHLDTAWSPPLPVILRASELFTKLDFELRYFECGNAFNGMFCCRGGEVSYDESGPYFGERGG
ncbi:MAG: hypothetical protein U0790_02115 [Isosphaeraceae bacterium]